MGNKTHERGPLSWRTHEINKKVKNLILGSFTSWDGMDNYYYCSKYNDFYYFLDYALFLNEKDIDFKDKKSEKEKKSKEIKEQILNSGKSKFIKLRNKLCDSDNKDELRKEIRDSLLKEGFDICDVFEQVYMKDETKDDDSNIRIRSNDTIYAEDSLLSINNSDIETVYCTSKYVEKQFNKMKKRLGIKEVKVVSLPSPSRLNKTPTSEKLKDWKIKFKR